MSEPDPTTHPVGPARVLALTYAFFVLAAGARGGVQITTRFSVAPVAYLLSAAAAAVYAVGLAVFVLVERDARRRAWAVSLCATELGGVLLVGLVSELAPRAFPDATVWSGFGAGYGYVPLALPVLGLAWVRWGGGRRPAGRRATPTSRPRCVPDTAGRCDDRDPPTVGRV